MFSFFSKKNRKQSTLTSPASFFHFPLLFLNKKKALTPITSMEMKRGAVRKGGRGGVGGSSLVELLK